jgi:hypothetical protein
LSVSRTTPGASMLSRVLEGSRGEWGVQGAVSVEGEPDGAGCGEGAGGETGVEVGVVKRTERSVRGGRGAGGGVFSSPTTLVAR